MDRYRLQKIRNELLLEKLEAEESGKLQPLLETESRLRQLFRETIPLTEQLGAHLESVNCCDSSKIMMDRRNSEVLCLDRRDGEKLRKMHQSSLAMVRLLSSQNHKCDLNCDLSQFDKNLADKVKKQSQDVHDVLKDSVELHRNVSVAYAPRPECAKIITDPSGGSDHSNFQYSFLQDFPNLSASSPIRK